jgi:dolichol-phosphate mannosyltransferase
MEAQRVVLSVVSPVYQAAGSVAELVRRITTAARQITDSFEIVLVDDRSSDDSWAKIVAAAKADSHVRGARLSRNFGQHAAITAGLELARGGHVVVMDCDLQHDPAEMPRLWEKAQEGCDVVLARTDERKHASHRNFAAWAFRSFNTLASGKEQMPTNVGTYSLLSRKVVDAFLRLPEKQRHYFYVLRSIGFSVGYVDVPHQERFEGQSSYTVRKLLRHALDGFLSQSQRMLHFSLALGLSYITAAFIATTVIVVRWALWGFKEGWASVVVLILGSTGFILLTLGVLGLYIGAIFEQVRNRPIYLIDETTDTIR